MSELEKLQQIEQANKDLREAVQHTTKRLIEITNQARILTVALDTMTKTLDALCGLVLENNTEAANTLAATYTRLRAAENQRGLH